MRKELENYTTKRKSGIRATKMDRKPDKKTMMLLKEHLIFLKKRFSPLHVYLFGSRARGDNLEESDIDLLIVSEKFRNINFRERMIQAYGLWDKVQDLEQLCFTPEEVQERSKEIGIVQQAMKEGIKLV